jgi:hypothetical protein
MGKVYPRGARVVCARVHDPQPRLKRLGEHVRHSIQNLMEVIELIGKI